MRQITLLILTSRPVFADPDLNYRKQPDHSFQVADKAAATAQNRRLGTLEQAFGQVLASRRTKRGMSQIDLAVASGYSLRYIGDVERGTKSGHCEQ